MSFSIFESTKSWAKQNQVLIFSKPEVDSTNRWAKMDFESTKSTKAIYLADFQSQGRGRFERKWNSPPKGTSLLSTWCYKLESPLQSPFPMRLGLELFNSLLKTWPDPNWSLKAPNDIFLADKKVSGLLIESSSTNKEHFLFIGLGLNAMAFPAEIQTAGSLMQDLDENAVMTRWVEFLNLWATGLDSLVRKSSLEELSTDEQKQILNALNRNPLLTEPYVRVLPNGDLYTQTNKISWQDL